MDENGFFAVEDGTKAVAFSLASDRQSVESLIAAANRAEAERWIPVSERLPERENGTDYSPQVLTTDGKKCECTRFSYWPEVMRRDDGDIGYWNNSHISPTHWRPLPAAPKEVQS
jgi:hypothetical protein